MLTRLRDCLLEAPERTVLDTMAALCSPCVSATDTAAERNSRTARFKLRAVRAALARPVWYRISPTCREFGVTSQELRDWIKDRDELEMLCMLEACLDAVALESQSPDSPRCISWPHNSTGTEAPASETGPPPPMWSNEPQPCLAKLSARQTDFWLDPLEELSGENSWSTCRMAVRAA